MPDQVHNSEKDFVYFVFGDFLAIGCYQQIPSSKIKQKSLDVTRATIQKSLCYFTKNFNYSPMGLSYIRARIQDFFNAYFEQARHGSFDNKAILESLHKDMPQIIATATSQTTDIPDHRHLKSSPVLRLLSRFGRTVLSLLKLLLLEKRVVIYGLPVSETSDLILGLTSLIPLFNEKRSVLGFIEEGSHYEAPELPSGVPGRAYSKSFVVNPLKYEAEEQEFSKLQLPLRVACYSFISGQVVLTQADWLNALPSYFVATSNALLPMKGHVLDLDASFDATTARLVTYGSPLEQALKLTPEDAAFMDFVSSKVQTETQSDPFAEFVVVDDFLNEDEAHDSCGSGGSGGVGVSNRLSDSESSFTPGTAAAWHSKETWVRTMFAGYVKALLASVSAHVQGETAASRFNAHFLTLWSQTRNYHAWRSQIDVRALHADPTYNDLNHPGLSLALHTPNSLVGKGFQTVKGSLQSVSDSFSSLTSSTSNFVSAINSAWQSRGYQNSSSSSSSPSRMSSNPSNSTHTSQNTWGLDAHLASTQTPHRSNPSQPSHLTHSHNTGSQSHKHDHPSPNSSSTPSPSSSSSIQKNPHSPATHPSRTDHNNASASTNHTPTRTPSFFESVKQKLSSPFGRVERAERTAAQFQQMPLDGGPPTIIQPAQLAHTTPNNPTQPTTNNDSDEDLLGF